MVEKNDRTPRMSRSLWYTVTFILCTFAQRPFDCDPDSDPDIGDRTFWLAPAFR